MSEIMDRIKLALAEDIGSGDVTTLATISSENTSKAILLAKADGIIAGLEIAKLVFITHDPGISFKGLVSDGTPIKKGDILAQIEGNTRSLLETERTALNFLQRMSGIATATDQYVQAVKPFKAIILDTRKTAPCLRLFDKMAVKLGGGQNHRIGLYDMYLSKDNHLAACKGDIEVVFRSIQKHNTNNLPIEIEVDSLDQFKILIKYKVSRILLDNMSLSDMKTAVEINAHKIPLEASGNVSLETVNQVAATGVDFISVGKLTHSVKALDISLDIN